MEQFYPVRHTWLGRILFVAMALLLGFSIWLLRMDPGGWAGVVFLALVLLALMLGGLCVQADAMGIRIRLLRFFQRRVDWADVRGMQAVTYRPLGTYGGWGYRFSFHKSDPGVAIAVGGNQAVRLDLHNGRHVLIGAPDAESLATALREEWEKHPTHAPQS